MAKDYPQLWKDVTSARDERKAVRILAEILADREGRTFIRTLKRADAELCIEILDHVSLSLIRPICFLLPRLRWPFSLGHRKTYPQDRGEADFLPHAEETRWNSCTVAGVDDDNGKDRGFGQHTRFRGVCRYQDRNVFGCPRRGEDHEG